VRLAKEVQTPVKPYLLAELPHRTMRPALLSKRHASVIRPDIREEIRPGRGVSFASPKSSVLRTWCTSLLLALVPLVDRRSKERFRGQKGSDCKNWPVVSTANHEMLARTGIKALEYGPKDKHLRQTQINRDHAHLIWSVFVRELPSHITHMSTKRGQVTAVIVTIDSAQIL